MADTPEDWTDEQNELYTRTFKFLVANQGGVKHDKTPEISPQEWETICHNAALVAAEMLESDDLRIIDGDTERVIAETPPSVTH